MKYRIGKPIIFCVLGAAIFAAGLVLIILMPDAKGILMTLPYICIGVGAGVFGGSLGTAIKNYQLNKDPKAAKQMEIEQKDERNQAISCKAKAKAYDLLFYVLGAVTIAFALMNEEIYITLTLVFVELLAVGARLYYFVKYQKEM